MSALSRDIIWRHEQGGQLASVGNSWNWPLQSFLVHANASGCHIGLGFKLYSQQENHVKQYMYCPHVGLFDS
jgi:hypothetical protein